MFSRSQSQTGSALTVALGLLVILLIIALVYVADRREGQHTTSRPDQSDQVAARLLAQSGLQLAVSPPDQQSSRKNQKYWGEDWNEDGKSNPVPPGGHEATNGNNRFGLERLVDPKYALRPSFAIIRKEDRNKPPSDQRPDLVRVKRGNETVWRGYSLRMTPKYKGGHSTATLSIRDNSTKLNINSLNKNGVKRVINNIYRELGHSVPSGEPPPGDKIVNQRSAAPGDPVSLNTDLDNLSISGGYDHVATLKKENILTEKQYEVLNPYLITHEGTWVDRSVIHPDAEPSPNQNVLQPRAPVNINKAPFILLQALVTGISGKARVHKPNGTIRTKAIRIEDESDEPETLDSTGDQIAKKILQYRQGNITIPFRGDSEFGDQKSEQGFHTWPEFEAFVDHQLVKNDMISIEQGYLLKAHFNPNTRFGTLNTEESSRWSWRDGNDVLTIDKSDLTQYTTEFTFMGDQYFTIRSYGRVTNGDHEIEAEASLRALLHRNDRVKHTTQRDFFLNRTRQNNIQLYPEQTKDLPSSAIVSPVRHRTGTHLGGQMTGEEQTGFDGSAVSHHDYMYWDFNGIKEQDYPEPHDLYAGSRKMALSLHKNKRSLEYKRDHHRPPRGAVGGTQKHTSDLSAEGVLINSNRGRSIRFPLDSDHFARWQKGHLEFWWKPQANLSHARSEIPLVNLYFLSDNFQIRTPHLDGASIKEQKNILSIQENITTHFPVQTFPNVLSDQSVKAHGAGYRIALNYHPSSSENSKDAGYQANITFLPNVTARDQVLPMTSIKARNFENGDWLTAANVVSHLPQSEAPSRLTPEAGKWMHVVLEWFPDQFSGSYFGDQPDGEIRPDTELDKRHQKDCRFWMLDCYYKHVFEGSIETVRKTHEILNLRYWINGTGTDEHDPGFHHPPYPGSGYQTVYAHQLAGNDHRRIKTRFLQGTASGSNKKQRNEKIPNAKDAFTSSIKLQPQTDKTPVIFRNNQQWNWSLELPELTDVGSLGEIGDRNMKPRYDGPTLEGTVDEIILSDQPNRDPDGFQPNRYPIHPSVEYAGQFVRKNAHPQSDYANVSQRVLPSRKKHRIKKIAHTQYRPAIQNFSQDERDESSRPHFNVYIDGNRAFSHGDYWLGAPRTPEELIGHELTLSKAENVLSYHFKYKNPDGLSERTSFVEDISILYRLPSPEVSNVSYYTPR